MDDHVPKLLVILLCLTFPILTPYTTKAYKASPGPQVQRLVYSKPWHRDPVKIIAVRTNQIPNIELGQGFDAGDDWLDGLTVTVSNTYTKAATVMMVELIFRREAGDIRPPLDFALHLGPRARSSEYAQRDPTKAIKFGRTANLELTAGHYRVLKDLLRQAGYTTVKRVEIVVTEVGFEDGSMIYSGSLYLQDPAYPNDPTKKIKVRDRPRAYNRMFVQNTSTKGGNFFRRSNNFIWLIRPRNSCFNRHWRRVESCGAA